MAYQFLQKKFTSENIVINIPSMRIIRKITLKKNHKKNNWLCFVFIFNPLNKHDALLKKFNLSRLEDLLVYFEVMILIKNIRKTACSEWVIRNSLYWMSAYSRWKLDEYDDYWIVSFDTVSGEVEFEFERLLNDYKLRERLQSQTGQVRNSIIENVLKSIDSRLAQWTSCRLTLTGWMMAKSSLVTWLVSITS